MVTVLFCLPGVGVIFELRSWPRAGVAQGLVCMSTCWLSGYLTIPGTEIFCVMCFVAWVMLMDSDSPGPCWHWSRHLGIALDGVIAWGLP